MLIHIQHAVQKELTPDRLVFRFETVGAGLRLSALGRRLRRESAADPPSSPVEIRPRDRLFCRLLPAAGPVSFRLPRIPGADCHLILSPMRSLDRHGQDALRITPRFSEDGADLVYTEFWIGKERLLYISPENLINRTFREALNRIVRGAVPGCLVIDEADAVSEWSENFRVAYRRIPRMIEDLRRYGPELSVLAVTAASKKRIGPDVCGMLGLEDRSPLPRRDVYRAGVSHQVVVVRGPEEKEKAYERLLWREIPAMLEREGVAIADQVSFPQYRDPYALCFGGASADGGNPTDVSMTERRFRDSGSPHILVHTGMGDSVTDWLYKTAEAGRGGRRVHCIRLADLPDDACEADLERRGSRIPQCRNQVCCFGRPALCDYGKEHHVIQQAHPGIRRVFSDTFRVLDRLLASAEVGDRPVRIPFTGDDGGKTAMALHRLSLMGVIDVFFVDHRDGPPAFTAYGFKPALTAPDAALRVLRYLDTHDIARGGAALPRPSAVDIWESGGDFADAGTEGCATTGAWLREMHAATPFLAYDRHRRLFQRLAVYLLPMLCWVPENRKAMAYRRLWNLKTFMRGDSCRYARMLRTVHAVDEGWRCEACDRCRPDLAFELPAPIPERLPRPPEEAERFLREWLEADAAPMGEAASRALAALGENLTLRAERLLEETPCNIKALDLSARHAAGEDRKRREQDLTDVRTRDRDLARVRYLCEAVPDGAAVIEALCGLASDEGGS